MNIPIGKLHSFDCFFTNSSYNCPAMKLYGYSTERALSARLKKARRTLDAQGESCKAISK